MNRSPASSLSKRHTDLPAKSVPFYVAGFWALGLAVANPRVFDPNLPFGLPGSCAQALLMTLGGSGLLLRARRRSSAIPAWLRWSMFAWIVGMLSGATMSVTSEAWRVAVAWTLHIVLGFGLFEVAKDIRIRKVAVWSVIWAGLGWSIYVFDVFRDFQGFIPRNYFMNTPNDARAYDHNGFGVFLAGGTAAALAFALRRTHSGIRLLLSSSILGIGVVAVVLSGSRSALLALAGGVLVAVTKARPLSKQMSRLAGLVVPAFAVFLALNVAGVVLEQDELLARRYDFADIETQTHLSSGRPELLQKGFLLLATRPLGIGPHSFRHTAAPIRDFRQSVEGKLLHNQYLTFAVEGGWFAAAGWAWLLWMMVIRPLKVQWAATVDLALFAAWISFAIMMCFAEFAGNFFWMILFVMAAPIAAAYGGVHPTGKIIDDRGSDRSAAA